MTINIHQINDIRIAEILSEQKIIATVDDGLNLLVDLYYQDFDKIIIHEKNITPNFFDLKTGIAGEILQKFSNYRIQLAIVGDFSKYSNKNFQDFIYESNKVRQINFVGTQFEAVEVLLIS